MSESLDLKSSKSIAISESSDSDGDIKIVKKRKLQKTNIIDIDDIEQREKAQSHSLKKQCELGNLELVQSLIKSGEKPNEACVYRAAKFGKDQVVDYLLNTLETRFNIGIFVFVRDPKTLRILLSRKDLLNPAQDSSEEKMLEGVLNYSEFVEKAKVLKKKSDHLIRLCREGDKTAIQKCLASNGHSVSSEALHEVLDRKNRAVFSLFIEKDSFFLQNPSDKRPVAQETDEEAKSRETDPNASNYVLSPAHLVKISRLGWHKELQSMLQRGMRFRHTEVDESDAKLCALLARFPRNLDFPFNAVTFWVENKSNASLLSAMEEAIAVKQKVARLFSHAEAVKCRSEADAAYTEALLNAMNDFLKLRM